MGFGKMKNEIIGNGAKLFLRWILINVMCFFVALSFQVLATAVFTQNIGYKVYGTLENEEKSVELYTHYSADGEDGQAAQYEEQGYVLKKLTIRSEMSRAGNIAFLTVTQIFCIMILIIFIYPNLWDLGTKDSNLVKFKHKAEDKYKGVKIGLIAVIPVYLVLILLCVMKGGLFPGFPVALYRLSHSAFYSLIGLMVGNALEIAGVAWWRMALLFLLPLLIPLFAGVSYYLGYRNFSIGEKLIYKKNRE